MPDNTILSDRPNVDKEALATKIRRWGALASFLMAASFIVAHWIYFTGNLRDAIGPVSYTLADFLYGPVWAAGLVTAVYALRERVGERAPRAMTLALLIALAAACAFVAVASIRSANRHYHLTHPDLRLETSLTVLTVWATLVAGVIGAAWHFLGWAFILIGLAGWTSQRLPRVLSVLYVAAGGVALAVYAFPLMEGNALVLALVISVSAGNSSVASESESNAITWDKRKSAVDC